MNIAPVLGGSSNVLATNGGRLSTAANTYAVDLASRQQVWSYPAGGHLTLSAQGILFIAQSSGKLTAVSVR